MKAPRRIGLVLLAAGESRRMGTPKQLLPFEGKPLVRHAAQVAVASGCSPVVVVLGSSSQNIAAALEGLPVRAVTNSRWAEGMGTSIQAGLAALAPEHLDGVVITLADQPFVNAAHLAHLIAAQRRTNRPIIASEYSGTAGIPALFMRPVFDELNALDPHEGCKRVILALREAALFLACPEAAQDIDTPEDFAAITVGAQRSA